MYLRTYMFGSIWSCGSAGFVIESLGSFWQWVIYVFLLYGDFYFIYKQQALYKRLFLLDDDLFFGFYVKKCSIKDGLTYQD